MVCILGQVDSIHAGWIPVIALLSGLIGSAGPFIWNAWLKRKELNQKETDEQRKQRKEDEQTAIDHYEKINARLDKEIKEQGEINRQKDVRLDRQSELLSRERVTTARMLVWIRHLEERLRATDTKFKPWDEVVRETQGILPSGDEGDERPIRSAPETTVE
jgi:hypothetical protein